MSLSLKTAKIQLELQYVQKLGQLARLKASVREYGTTWDDQSRLHDLQEQIARLQRAQERSQQGRYGLCVACGNPITPERLEVVPDAELCMSCHQEHIHATLRHRHLLFVHNQ